MYVVFSGFFFCRPSGSRSVTFCFLRGSGRVGERFFAYLLRGVILRAVEGDIAQAGFWAVPHAVIRPSS
jgi:hypothetical protein